MPLSPYSRPCSCPSWQGPRNRRGPHRASTISNNLGALLASTYGGATAICWPQTTPSAGMVVAGASWCEGSAIYDATPTNIQAGVLYSLQHLGYAIYTTARPTCQLLKTKAAIRCRNCAGAVTT